MLAKLFPRGGEAGGILDEIGLQVGQKEKENPEFILLYVLICSTGSLQFFVA